MLKPAVPKLAHISLALAGGMWAFPFLHYRHQYPLTTFYQEWWSALLGVLALTLLTARDYWQQPEIPRIAQLPIALLGVLLLQWGLGYAVYDNQMLLYGLYLLFAALLMMLGARLRECFGMKRLAEVLAGCLLLGAAVSALFGVLQHYRWHTFLDPVVAVKVSSSVFGNLAQPNHFANYIALGLASLGLLFQTGRLKLRAVVPLAIPLLFVMALSGSRSTWLYLGMMAALAWRGAYRDAALRPLLRYALALFAGFILMHFIVRLPFLTGASGVSGTIDTAQRLFGDSASGSVRLYLWYEAVRMFLQAPLLGTGFGQFAWQHFVLLPELTPAMISPDAVTGMYNNAHNIVFQLAAEAGLAGVLALLVPLAAWLWGVRRVPLDAVRWWGYAVLGVLAIHSLLEYPLWYTYFVAVGALLLGAMDETRYRLELRGVGRLSVAAMLVLGLLTLMQLRSGYQQLEHALRPRPASVVNQAMFEEVRDTLVDVYRGSLLSPYAEMAMSGMIEVNDEHLDDKLELNSRVMRFTPTNRVVYRQAMLLAQAGRMEEARYVMARAIWCFPSDFPEMREQLDAWAAKDPARFSALLEFALQKQQEYLRAVRR